MIDTLLPQFGGFAWTLLAFVIALSIIVAIHEYGHYIVGRWCGIKADVFSVGFGPIIWSRVDRHGTRWQLAALPLGGYVKFRGDANAASVGADDTTLSMTEAERRQTMTGAALWRRAATVVAGPVFNFILSIVIFAGFVLASGQVAEETVVGDLKSLPASVATLQPGDEIVTVGGQPVSDLGELLTTAAELPSSRTLPYEVRRDGATLTVDAGFPMPARAEQVQAPSAAWDVGLRAGDVITAIDGEEVHSFQDLQAKVAGAEGAPLGLDVWRPDGDAGELLSVTLSPRTQAIPTEDGGFENRYLIGITGALFFDPMLVPVGPVEALEGGVTRTWRTLELSLSAIRHIVTGQISSCNLSGPIGIAKASGAAASMGLPTFILLIASLSAAVGMLNLFPIPVLDGGHLVFHAYEAVRGKPPSDGAVRILMTVGVALMVALMVFALFNDVTC